MALSIPNAPQNTVWDRTLPKLPDVVDPRRSSSLLQHQISSSQFLNPASDETGRRNTVACLPVRPEYVKASEECYVRSRQGSVMTGDSITEGSSEATSPPDTTDGYCLCIPSPKIPRPRNAFILYRQHQHPVIVAQHPSLTNPEISKIIGQQWRQIPIDEKNKWNALAEQEKARHAQQYPDYRYRPKRNGSKCQLPDGTSPATSHPTNCEKCNFKIMNPPHTPSHPGYDHHNGMPVVGVSRLQKRPYEAHAASSRAQSVGQVGPPHHPHMAPVRYAYAPPRHDSVHYTQSSPPLYPPQGPPVDGPDAKRRRMDPAYGPPPTRPSYDHTYYERDRPPYPHEQHSRQPVAPPQRAAPAPLPSAAPRPATSIQQRRDPSLTLPPLKTSGAPPRPAISPKTRIQKSSVEGAVMSHSVLTKLKTLHSITPVLAAPGPASPPDNVRGAIIAIEGLDQRRVFDMTNSLADQLEKEGKFLVRTFAGPNPYQVLESSRRASIGGESDTTSHAKYLNMIFEWHKVCKEMVEFITHKPNKDEDGQEQQDSIKAPLLAQLEERRVEHEVENSSTKRSPVSAVSPRTMEQSTNMNPVTPKTASLPKDNDQTPRLITRSRIPQAALDQQKRASLSKDGESPPPPSPSRLVTPSLPPSSPPKRVASTDRSNLIPIALVPHYQLTTVDACSIALPILDNYDPLTHWRWHATLWRGCVGPDVSIIIKSAHEQQEEEAQSEAKKADGVGHRSSLNVVPSGAPGHPPPHQHQPPQSSTSGPAPKSSTAPAQPATALTPAPFGVEVRLQDHRAVIVRTGGSLRGSLSNAGDSAGETELEKENENWEKAKRRVGFEVEESLRR